MKKVFLIILGTIFAVLCANAQKSVIDEFLESNPDIRERAAMCVNIAPETLASFYETLSLEAPERYQSLSICNASSAIERFETTVLLKKYIQLMSLVKEDGNIVTYYQRKENKRGKATNELLVCMRHHNDFSVIYLKGNDISINDLGYHLDIIKNNMERSKASNNHYINTKK